MSLPLLRTGAVVLSMALACAHSIAQTLDLDSLLKLSTSRNDTLRINALNELVRKYTPDSLVLAEELAGKALSQARNIRYSKGVITALRNSGVVADFNGNLDKAISCYDEALEMTSGKPEWLKEHAILLINKGVAYYYAGDLGKALVHYLEAEPLYKDLNDPYAHARLLNNLAVVYRQLKRNEDAIRIYEKSLKIKETSKDSAGIAATLHNIGLAYGYLQNNIQALQYIARAKQIYETIGDRREAASVNIALGDVLFQLGRLDESRQALQELMASDEARVSLHALLQSRLLLIKIHLAEKEYEQAIQVIDGMEQEVLQSSFVKIKQSIYELKAAALEGLGQYEAAYFALRNFTQYGDSLLTEERIKLEKDMETKYLTKEKDNLIQIQELQLLKNQRERIALSGAILALLLILGLAYRLSLVRKKANAELSEKNLQVQKALEEKEVLLKEIHHRVKNNLQIIASLLSLQSRHIEDPKALEAIQEGRNRVHSMALIHKSLYQDERLVGVDTVAYINNLTESLIVNYNLDNNNLIIAKDIDPMTLDVDTIIPLGLILNELISNTLKYAFPEGRPGKMFLALKREGAGLRLRISDNGQGLPPNINTENLKSLGFRLVKALTQKLEGQLYIQSEKGTQIDLYIPEIKAA